MAARSSAPRARRTILSVPGSSGRFLHRSTTVDADEVMLDLEDGVAAPAKDKARAQVAQAAAALEWSAPTVAVRVNGWQTPWTYRDVIDVIGAAGARIDAVVLPKVTRPGEVEALDLLLTQVERAAGLQVGRIGIEVLIENARALRAIDAIATASPRVEALVLGPGDMMTSLGMPALEVGALTDAYPGDPLHHVYAAILVAARANSLQAIDGPFTAVRDVPGFRAAAGRVAALGFDGKWVLHPDQVAAGNEAFAPDERSLARAKEMLDGARRAARRGVGAVMVGDEMVDEAGVQLAEATLARHRRTT